MHSEGLDFSVGMRDGMRQGKGIVSSAEWATDLNWESQSGHMCNLSCRKTDGLEDKCGKNNGPKGEASLCRKTPGSAFHGSVWMIHGNTALCFYSTALLSHHRVLMSTALGNKGQRWALSVNATALRTVALIAMPWLESDS